MSRRGAIVVGAALILLCQSAATASAQAGFGMRGGFRAPLDLVPQFDKDGDGKLDEGERKAAREEARSRGSGHLPAYRTTRVPAGSSTLGDDLRASAAAAVTGDPDLYDESTLRTLYIRFANADWYEELADFYDTGVEVPGELVVDGRLYASVGVRFRGNSSYRMTGDSLKKPFNVSLDYADEAQRLYGYRTLNLLNANTDPSLVREVLFLSIARHYIPAPKANFVKLVVNGESWGIYVNVQQFNRDFVQDWFGTGDGTRWKVPAGRGNGGALAYLGRDASGYRDSYELEGQDSPEAWRELIRLCETLSRLTGATYEEEIGAILDVDGALWELALENVFIDGDGYLSRGSDYLLYQEPGGRFHVVPYDNNETFRYAGGGGPNSWPSRDPMLSPLVYEGSAARPLVSGLLSVPALRARYLAHVRTIVEEWLSWERIEPLVASYRTLIDAELRVDDKKLYSYEAFLAAASGEGGGSSEGWRGGFGGGYGGGGPSLRDFVLERREFLLSQSALAGAAVEVRSLSLSADPMAGMPVGVTVQLGANGGRAESVLLHCASGATARFASVPMEDDGAHGDGKAGDGTYGATIPAVSGGTRLRYYVEVRSLQSLGSASFYPPAAEQGALERYVPPRRAASTPVVINELMAANSRSVRDPQRDFDDWLEIYNLTGSAVDLSGMYLTDKEEQPRTWQVPQGAVVQPHGFLVIWADEDVEAGEGLHAGFRLSASGETLTLVDVDARGNQILDSVRFGPQEQDVAIGRYPDGTGDFGRVRATPGKRNVPW